MLRRILRETRTKDKGMHVPESGVTPAPVEGVRPQQLRGNPSLDVAERSKSKISALK